MTIKQISFCTFLIETKTAKILINPTTNQNADVKIYSLKISPYLRYDFSEKELLVCNAGEFEVKDVFIYGRKNKNEDVYSYNIYAEGIAVGVICFTKKIDSVPEDLFETNDILLIGAGGGPFLDPKEANKIINKFAPSISICFGFAEHAPKDIQIYLESVENAKKEIHGLTFYEKPLKLDKEIVDKIENTMIYYFNV